MYKYVLILIACFPLLNCSTAQLYKGNKLAPEEIVIIEGESLTNFSCHTADVANTVKVCAFDNIELDTCQGSIEFLPGEHSFRLELSTYGITVLDKVYKLDFEAGERYCLSILSHKNGSLKPKLSYLGKYNKRTEKVNPGTKYIELSEHSTE